jgi:hypothetical protein
VGERSRIDRLERLTRAGWLSKGFVFVVIGMLAMEIALRDWGGSGSSRSADQTGALRAVAEQPLGGILLAAVALGLVVFGLWNVAQALVPESTDLDPLGLAQRIGWFGLGIFYIALAFAGFRLAAAALEGDDGVAPPATTSAPAGTSGSTAGTSGGSAGTGSAAGGGGTPSTTALTARLLDAPGGRWLVAVVAIVVLVVAAYHLRKGITLEFVDDLDTSGLDADQERWLGRLGVGGFTARAIVLAVVAWFLLRAAIDFDPDDAVGLDGALRELASLVYGKLLLVAVGLGLTVAGVYDMITFRLQQLR